MSLSHGQSDAKSKGQPAPTGAKGNEGEPAPESVNFDSLATPAQFRMVLISGLAAGVGLLAGVVAFLLYRSDRTLHQPFLLSSFLICFYQRAFESPWLVGDRDSGAWWNRDWLHG